MQISPQIVKFFSRQGPVLVSTLDSEGYIHTSVKGVVGIKEEGKIYLIDLYHNRTFRNLIQNPTVTLSGIDEYEFKGFAVQGKAQMIPYEKASSLIVEHWEEEIMRRLTRRTVKNIQGDVDSPVQHEMLMPDVPKYLIDVDIKRVIDLSPPHMRRGSNSFIEEDAESSA